MGEKWQIHLCLHHAGGCREGAEVAGNLGAVAANLGAAAAKVGAIAAKLEAVETNLEAVAGNLAAVVTNLDGLPLTWRQLPLTCVQQLFGPLGHFLHGYWAGGCPILLSGVYLFFCPALQGRFVTL